MRGGEEGEGVRGGRVWGEEGVRGRTREGREGIRS